MTLHGYLFAIFLNPFQKFQFCPMVCNARPVLCFPKDDPDFQEGKLPENTKLKNLLVRLLHFVEYLVYFQGKELVFGGLLHGFGRGDILV